MEDITKEFKIITLILLNFFDKRNVLIDDITVCKKSNEYFINFWYNKKLIYFYIAKSKNNIKSFFDGMLFLTSENFKLNCGNIFKEA